MLNILMFTYDKAHNNFNFIYLLSYEYTKNIIFVWKNNSRSFWIVQIDLDVSLHI